MPADSEEDVVEEEKCNGGRCDLFFGGVTGQFVVAQEDGDNQVAEALAGGTINHKSASAPSLDVGNGD